MKERNSMERVLAEIGQRKFWEGLEQQRGVRGRVGELNKVLGAFGVFFWKTGLTTLNVVGKQGVGAEGKTAHRHVTRESDGSAK